MKPLLTDKAEGGIESERRRVVIFGLKCNLCTCKNRFVSDISDMKRSEREAKTWWR